MLNVEWIFFDVGSTLVDETAAYDHRIREMIQDTDISYEDFDSKRIEFAALGFDGDSEAIKYFGLKKTPWHSEDERPFDDTFETLEHLKRAGYKLGIIANQTMGMAERLNSWGLLKFFDVIAASAELGVSKPNRLIFKKALELAGCLPQNSVMVGDRLDNDIIPAKSLEMKTIWVRKRSSRAQKLEFGAGIADLIIDDLAELKSIFG